jgi:hypothetical protein
MLYDTNDAVRGGNVSKMVSGARRSGVTAAEHLDYERYRTLYIWGCRRGQRKRLKSLISLKKAKYARKGGSEK